MNSISPTGRSPVNSETVSQAVLDSLCRHISLPLPAQAQYGPRQIFAPVLWAACHQSTIQDACSQLQDVPSPNTVRSPLRALPLQDLEQALQRALTDSPSRQVRRLVRNRRLHVAIDYHLIPYYGKPAPGEEDYILRSEARQGTTRFFGFATLFVLHNGRRYTLGLHLLRKDEEKEGVLALLLQRFSRLGGRVKRLYLDRGFYSVRVIRWLRRKGFAFVLAARVASHRLQRQVRRKSSVGLAYRVFSPLEGAVWVWMVIAVKNQRGKYGKHGRKGFAFVVRGWRGPVGGVFETYRRRFGVETSYRVKDDARARTSSRSTALRLFLCGLAFLLENLWVLLKWLYVSLPRKGGREVLAELFPFRRFLVFLRRCIEQVYGVIDEVHLPILHAA